MAREDWARGECRAHAGRAVFGMLAVTIFWNAISWTITLLGFDQIRHAGTLPALFISVFPLAGIGMAIASARLILRWRAFGESRFEMESVPAPVGGPLAGTIHAAHPLPPMRPVKLELACIRRRVSNTGSDRSTIDQVLWSDSVNATTDASGAIPVAFAIPENSRATDAANPSDRILWRLTAAARIAPVAYRAEFEIPVFAIKETAAQITEAAQLRAQHDARVSAYQRSAGSCIRIGLANDGSTEIYFPAFRNPGVALAVAGFFVVWMAVTAVLFHVHAPLIFKILWAFFDVILGVWMAALFFGSTRVHVRSDAMTVEKRFLGIVVARWKIASPEVTSVRAAVGMTSNNKALYQIRVKYGRDRNVDFGDGIGDVMEAEWLAQKIASLLGLRQATADPAPAMVPA